MPRKKISVEDERRAAMREARAEYALEHALEAVREARMRCEDAGRDRDATACEHALRLLPGSAQA